MATRRISQLDKFELSSVIDFEETENKERTILLPNALSGFLFEVSELYPDGTGKHYLSKKLTGSDLSTMMLANVNNILFSLSSLITEISGNLTNS